ncbi:MAG: NAD-dependent protein deacylase [Bacteroidia bacterium]|nr:MAG: NAD-dependent protein deacylase [Bacteroidia bacterium]
MSKHIVVFTGAGVSAESGLKTFRDSDGLWENYPIEEVATPEAWKRNPELVLEFYNLRRKQCMEAQPNEAHKLIAELEKYYKVTVITQNIDDLHERAGSSNVIHLHGEIMKVRSSVDENLIYPINKWNLELGEKCEKGSQLRPHIVWFGEPVPMMPVAIGITQTADIFIVVGSSLVVYPAASLLYYTKSGIPKYLIDPGEFSESVLREVIHIKKKATEGMRELFEILTKNVWV